MVEKFIPNHQHIVIKAYVKNPIKSEESLNKFLSELVNKVGMNVILGPFSMYVNDLGNEGITGAVILATSHASIHIWDAEEPYLVQMDLYSCKEFKHSDVISHIHDYMNIESVEFMVIDRNKDLSVVKQSINRNFKKSFI